MPKTTTDMRLAVDVRELFRSMAKAGDHRAVYCWNRQDQENLPVTTLFERKSSSLITVKHVAGVLPDESLDVIYTPCRFGGKRAWFQCSKIGCGRRVAILYDTPRGFRCRHCAHLDYASHRERAWDRLLRRTRRIRAKVDGGANLTESFPPKPKGMHWATYDRLLLTEAALFGEIAEKLSERMQARKTSARTSPTTS